MWPPAPPSSAPVPPPPRQRPRYSKFAALVLSFFSPSLYRDVARNWRGIGLLYLLLLLTLTWLPVLARWHFSVRDYAYGGAAASTLREFPTITINKGVVSIAEEEPYVWRDPEGGEVILYVDTTDAFDRPEAAQAKVLLGRSAVEVRNNPRETRVYDLSEVNYFYLDKNRMIAWTRWFSDRLVPLGLPTALLISFIWGLVRLLLYALIGLIFASIFGARLDFAALMRLAAVAMTPGMVLDALAWTLNFGWSPCCAWSVLIGVVTLIYLGFAVKANADAAPPVALMPAYGYPPVPGQYPNAPPPPPPPPYPPAR
jgi:hypothetical protein